MRWVVIASHIERQCWVTLARFQEAVVSCSKVARSLVSLSWLYQMVAKRGECMRMNQSAHQLGGDLLTQAGHCIRGYRNGT